MTATCSGADKPRYGHLAVDSNLPDTRIALGGPDRNAFTAALLRAGELIEVDVLDHVVLGRGRYVSMRQQKLGFS